MHLINSYLWGIFQAYSTENNPRITYSINDSWQFRLGTSDIGEDGWSMVSIPHTWNAEDCVDDFQVFIVVQDGIVRIYKWIVLC